MIGLAVAGCLGKMGRCVLELAAADERFEIVAALRRTAEGNIETSQRRNVETSERRNVETSKPPDAEEPPANIPVSTFSHFDVSTFSCDVLIDFTVVPGTMAWVAVCERLKVPMVIGATGHSAQDLGCIREAAQTIPIVQAENFSAGIGTILGVIGRIARELGEDYDVEVVETHHRHKLDAPSGTALKLVDSLNQSRAVVFGRHGTRCKRKRGEIGIHSLRMGEVVSQHEIHFSGRGETITIRHVAHSRETFAAGALRAAEWIIGKPPGLYSMRDCLSAPSSRM